MHAYHPIFSHMHGTPEIYEPQKSVQINLYTPDNILYLYSREEGYNQRVHTSISNDPEYHHHLHPLFSMSVYPQVVFHSHTALEMN